MSRALTLLQAGPGVSVQDRGRTGLLAQGLSRGGAADPVALHEGAALLGQPPECAAVEMAGFGGTFRASAPMVIALTGAPMAATLAGVRLRWNTTHELAPGQILEIGGAVRGVYGYLHVAGGVQTPPVLGGRSAHLAAGVGRLLAKGDTLPIGPDNGAQAGRTLPEDGRFGGGVVRVLPGVHAAMFDARMDAFLETTFVRDARANRMGVKLNAGDTVFDAAAGLNIVSEAVVPGDIQVAGDGTPFVLMVECQTTGGYPRIATVIPPDLPKIAQAPAGAPLSFKMIAPEAALAAYRAHVAGLSRLADRVGPVLRKVEEIDDLLSYQLISGVTAGDPDSEGRT